MSFVGALFLSFLLTLPLALYAWKRREVPAAKAVAITMAGVSWWTLCYALELLNYFEPDLVPEPGGLRLFWFRVMFIGVGAVPAAFLVFVLQYTGVRERISARLVCWLAVEPVIVVLVALTDGTFHDWFMAGFVGLRGEQFVGGPMFEFHVLYSYVLGLVTYGLLIRFIIHSRAYRKQAVLLLFGGLTATLANLISILALAPGELRGLDLTPFGFVVTAVMMLLSIRSQGFLDLMPIARSLIFEHMADGVLVTDGRGLLVDSNPRAREFFVRPEQELVPGEPLQSLVPYLFGNGRMAEEVEVNGRYLSVQKNAFYGRAGKIRGGCMASGM